MRVYCLISEVMAKAYSLDLGQTVINAIELNYMATAIQGRNTPNPALI
jgi:hypothetical protein